MLSIPNYPPFRQGKSLDYSLAFVVDKIMEKKGKDKGDIDYQLSPSPKFPGLV